MTAPQNTPTDPVLTHLPVALVSALQLSRHRRVRIERGGSIIKTGSNVDTVFMISEGWAVSRLQLETGDSQILDILGPGSIAGITRLDNTLSNGYSAIALQDISAYAVDVETLQNVCSGDEALSRWLMESLSLQTQRSQRHIAALGRLPAKGRLAFAMLRIIDIAQQNGGSAVNKTIRLPMTQEEIGNMLGLTNVSISKLMSAFRKDGLIDYGRNRIVVHDIAALSEICGMSLESQVDRSEAKPVETARPEYRAYRS